VNPTIRPQLANPHPGSFAGPIPAGPSVAVVVPADVQAVLGTQSPMWEKLDEIHHNLVEENHMEENRIRLVAGSATFLSVGASVLYFAWLFRAGSLVSSLLSSMPAWNFVDPLPILDQMGGEVDDLDEDQESLQSMVGED
jgi:hypothetical protein